MARGISRSVLITVFSLTACTAFAQVVGGFRGGAAIGPPTAFPGGAGPGFTAPPLGGGLGRTTPSLGGGVTTVPGLGSSLSGAPSYSGSGAAGRSSGSAPQQRAATTRDAAADVRAELESARLADIYSLPIVDKFTRAGGL